MGVGSWFISSSATIFCSCLKIWPNWLLDLGLRVFNFENFDLFRIIVHLRSKRLQVDSNVKLDSTFLVQVCLVLVG